MEAHGQLFCPNKTWMSLCSAITCNSPIVPNRHLILTQSVFKGWDTTWSINSCTWPKHPRVLWEFWAHDWDEHSGAGADAAALPTAASVGGFQFLRRLILEFLNQIERKLRTNNRVGILWFGALRYRFPWILQWRLSRWMNMKTLDSNRALPKHAQLY